jgi:Fibronectin type III-like domain
LSRTPRSATRTAQAGRLTPLQAFALPALDHSALPIALDRRSLAYYDVAAHAWDVAPGVYRVLVGASSADTQLNGAIPNLFPSSVSVLESSPVPDQD